MWGLNMLQEKLRKLARKLLESNRRVEGDMAIIVLLIEAADALDGQPTA